MRGLSMNYFFLKFIFYGSIWLSAKPHSTYFNFYFYMVGCGAHAFMFFDKCQDCVLCVVCWFSFLPSGLKEPLESSFPTCLGLVPEEKSVERMHFSLSPAPWGWQCPHLDTDAESRTDGSLSAFTHLSRVARIEHRVLSGTGAAVMVLEVSRRKL